METVWASIGLPRGKLRKLPVDYGDKVDIAVDEDVLRPEIHVAKRKPLLGSQIPEQIRLENNVPKNLGARLGIST